MVEQYYIESRRIICKSLFFWIKNLLKIYFKFYNRYNRQILKLIQYYFKNIKFLFITYENNKLVIINWELDIKLIYISNIKSIILDYPQN